eukprot:gene4019-8001_t
MGEIVKVRLFSDTSKEADIFIPRKCVWESLTSVIASRLGLRDATTIQYLILCNRENYPLGDVVTDTETFWGLFWHYRPEEDMAFLVRTDERAVPAIIESPNSENSVFHSSLASLIQSIDNQNQMWSKVGLQGFQEEPSRTITPDIPKPQKVLSPDGPRMQSDITSDFPRAHQILSPEATRDQKGGHVSINRNIPQASMSSDRQQIVKSEDQYTANYYTPDKAPALPKQQPQAQIHKPSAEEADEDSLAKEAEEQRQKAEALALQRLKLMEARMKSKMGGDGASATTHSPPGDTSTPSGGRQGVHIPSHGGNYSNQSSKSPPDERQQLQLQHMAPLQQNRQVQHEPRHEQIKPNTNQHKQTTNDTVDYDYRKVSSDEMEQRRQAEEAARALEEKVKSIDETRRRVFAEETDARERQRRDEMERQRFMEANENRHRQQVQESQQRMKQAEEQYDQTRSTAAAAAAQTRPSDNTYNTVNVNESQRGLQHLTSSSSNGGGSNSSNMTMIDDTWDSRQSRDGDRDRDMSRSNLPRVKEDLMIPPMGKINIPTHTNNNNSGEVALSLSSSSAISDMSSSAKGRNTGQVALTRAGSGSGSITGIPQDSSPISPDSFGIQYSTRNNRLGLFTANSIETIVLLDEEGDETSCAITDDNKFWKFYARRYRPEEGMLFLVRYNAKIESEFEAAEEARLAEEAEAQRIRVEEQTRERVRLQELRRKLAQEHEEAESRMSNPNANANANMNVIASDNRRGNSNSNNSDTKPVPAPASSSRMRSDDEFERERRAEALAQQRIEAQNRRRALYSGGGGGGGGGGGAPDRVDASHMDDNHSISSTNSMTSRQSAMSVSTERRVTIHCRMCSDPSPSFDRIDIPAESSWETVSDIIGSTFHIGPEYFVEKLALIDEDGEDVFGMISAAPRFWKAFNARYRADTMVFIAYVGHRVPSEVIQSNYSTSPSLSPTFPSADIERELLMSDQSNISNNNINNNSNYGSSNVHSSAMQSSSYQSTTNQYDNEYEYDHQTHGGGSSGGNNNNNINNNNNNNHHHAYVDHQNQGPSTSNNYPPPVPMTGGTPVQDFRQSPNTSPVGHSQSQSPNTSPTPTSSAHPPDQYQVATFLKICSDGDMNGAKQMVSGNGLDVNVRDPIGLTAMHVVCIMGRMELAQWLLQQGASFSSRDKEGMTPLHYACDNKHVQLALLLVRNGADSSLRNKAGITSLHIICIRGVMDLTQLIRDYMINVATGSGLTLLHCAADQGHDSVVKYLIKHGAQLHARDDDGMTPLHLACIAGHFEASKSLIESGAYWNARDDEGMSPLLYVCQEGHYDLMVMLIESDANIHARNNAGATSLHLACESGNTDIVQYLMDRHLDPDIRRKDGLTSYQLAQRTGNIDIADLLSSQGASNPPPEAEIENALRVQVESKAEAAIRAFEAEEEANLQLEIMARTSGGK